MNFTKIIISIMLFAVFFVTVVACSNGIGEWTSQSDSFSEDVNTVSNNSGGEDLSNLNQFGDESKDDSSEEQSQPDQYMTSDDNTSSEQSSENETSAEQSSGQPAENSSDDGVWTPEVIL